MENTVKNKSALKVVLSVLCVAAVAAVSSLVTVMACSGKEAAASENGGETVSVELIEVDDSAKNAAEIFKYKVSDTGDTAVIADLLKAVKLDEAAGKYTVRIDKIDNVRVLTLKIDDSVRQADRDNFDANMEICAEQILALIDDVQRVEWRYDVITKDVKKETAVLSIDAAGAKEALGKDIKGFGKSEDSVGKLLTLQKNGSSS